MLKNIVLGAGLSVLAINSYADVFNGRLVDHLDRPLANALVKVRDGDASVRSNDDGTFTLNLPVGAYVLDIKAGKKGHFHQSIEVTGEETLQIVHVDENHESKLVITANPLEHTKLDMAMPALVLAGDELILKRSSNLGEMLQLEPGMSVSSFGPAVSRPVIRGLSGPRVLITNNQMTVQDASVTSADHDVSVEPLLANQIEVLKGPATLLYGSGAIGGVVNITNSRINPTGAPDVTGGLEARFGDSATGERSYVGTVTGGNESFAWHFDAFETKFDDIEIPGFAESLAYREAEEEHEHEEHGDEHGDEHSEEEVFGLLEDSRSKSNGAGFGLTWNGDWGYFGFSMDKQSKLYGVPGHSHGHEEEHSEEHMGEEHEHEEEGVSIDLEQARFDMQGVVFNPFDGIQDWFVSFSRTSYQHIELEGEEDGTLFDNLATEVRSYMQHEPIAGWDGIIGIQYNDREFSALGEEAFVPPSDSDSLALFIVEEKRFGDYKVELGARFEEHTNNTEGFSEFDRSTFSFSSGVVYDLSDTNTLAVNFSRAERVPTVEEFFSFGEHAATRTFEIGSPNLEDEVSNNFDISYRFDTGNWRGEINGYYNQFDGFIYGANEFNNGSVVDFDGFILLVDDEYPIIRYQQEDATISGIEIDVETSLVQTEAYDLSLGLMADFIEAELDSGAYIPRIPPLKYGVILKYDDNNLFADLSIINYDDQQKIDVNELPTEGFTIVDLEVGYRIGNRNSDTLLFLRGRNLLDEEARDHASFLKDLAPRAGRNLVAGFRYTF